MPKDYLDDFVCDVTCEEFYDEDEDMFWGDQDEQAHAGGMIDIMAGAAYLTKPVLDIRSQWEMNAETVENIYGAHTDWRERFYLCPECGEPIYESDWTSDELSDFLCPVCEFEEEID